MKSIMDKIDYEKILKKAPEHYKATVDGLVKFFKKNTTNMSQIVKLTFMWLAYNIEYDKESHFSTEKTARLTLDEILQKGKCVCQGYADLFTEITKKCGIEVEFISGYAKGYGYDPEKTGEKSNHAWNAFKLDGKWNLVDSTWAAGSPQDKTLSKKYDEFYYCAKPEQLIKTHFPDDPKWQLLDPPISRHQFDIALLYSSEFYNTGFLHATPNKAILESTGGTILIQLFLRKKIEYFPNIKAGLDLISGEETIKMDENILIQREERGYTLKGWLPENGKYNLSISATKKSVDNLFHQIVKYRINVRGLASPLVPKFFAYPKQYSLFQKLRGSIITPREGTLIFGEKYKFNINVSNIEKMQVLCGENWYPVNKSKDSNLYCEDIEIEDMSVGVYVKFPDKEKYECILKYCVEELKNFKAVTPVTKHIETINKCGLSNFPKEKVLVAKKNKLFLEMDADPKCSVIGSLSINDKKKVEEAFFIQKRGSHIEIGVGFPGNGMYQLILFSKMKKEKGLHQAALEYSVQVTESKKIAVKFPTLYSIFDKIGAYLLEPHYGILKVGSKQDFRIKLPKVESAYIFMVKAQIPMKKGENDIFSTSSPILITRADSVSIYIPDDKGTRSLTCLVKFRVEF